MKINRNIRLILGTVIMLFLGLIYAWSVFVAPLEAEFGWTRAQTSMTFTISMIFFIVGLLSCGVLVKKLSRRSIMLISAFCTLLGFVLCSRVAQVWQLYISYGVLIGFGVGLANNALVSSIVAWFPEKSGIASGILMMGFGLGGLFFSPLATWLMSEYSWRSTFLGFGIAFAVVIASGWFFTVPPADSKANAAIQQAQNFSTMQVVSRPSFWIYIVWFCLVMAGGLMVIGHANPFAVDLGATVATASMLTGMLSLFNGIGRIITGITCDKLGIRKSMQLTTVYLLLAAVLITLASFTKSIPLLAIGFIVAGICYGGGPTSSSVFARSFYGPQFFAGNYAAVSSGMIPGALLGPYLAGILHDTSGGYLSSFMTMIVFAILALIILRFLKKA